MHMSAFPATPKGYVTMLVTGPIWPRDLGHFRERGKNQAPAYSVSDKRSTETLMVFQCDPWILLCGITHHKPTPQNMCHTHSWPQHLAKSLDILPFDTMFKITIGLHGWSIFFRFFFAKTADNLKNATWRWQWALPVHSNSNLPTYWPHFLLEVISKYFLKCNIVYC